VAVAVVVAAAAAVASCCGPVATTALRGGSLVVTALPAAHGALDERRLVGTDASDLSALAGVRAGTDGATLRTGRQKTELQPLETETSGGGTAYLKVEKPHFLFLEGSAGAAVAPVVVAATLPDASAARATSCTDRPAAGASAPITGACSSSASAALGEGARDSTSQGGPPLITLLFFLLSRRRILWSRRWRESVLLAQPVLFVPLLPALPPPDSLFLPARRPLLLPSLCGAGNCSGLGRGRVRPRGVHGHPLLKNDCQNRVGTLQQNKKGRKAYSPPGCRGA
jgi:hypothetical protein